VGREGFASAPHPSPLGLSGVAESGHGMSLSTVRVADCCQRWGERAFDRLNPDFGVPADSTSRIGHRDV
jgi:hypothetical protein